MMRDVNGEHEALVVYTSGTTGSPKGVVLTQRNLMADARAIAEWHGIGPDDRMMCVLPIHHVNGTVVTIVTPMFAGGSVVLNQKFHSSLFFQRIAAERVSIVSVVPTLLQFLLHESRDLPEPDISSLRHIICGAGPLTVELAMAFEDRFRIPIIHGYGLSETTCYSCFLPVDLSPAGHRRWLSDFGYPSIGVPIPPNEMAIHDPAGRALEAGAKGEIVIRGWNVMKEYYQNPEANEAAFSHGWFRSGDEGFFMTDDSGRAFFFITGRIKELIIRGGINISPFEIDEVLMNMPGVKAGLAVGFENDWYGEEVGAYIQPKEGVNLTGEEVIAWCRTRFPFSKCPKVVLFGDDIPVTSTGKYQRNRLRHLFAGWKTTQFSGRSRG
jgi:long-chain acyl-CoA synthetase